MLAGTMQQAPPQPGQQQQQPPPPPPPLLPVDLRNPLPAAAQQAAIAFSSDLEGTLRAPKPFREVTTEERAAKLEKARLRQEAARAQQQQRDMLLRLRAEERATERAAGGAGGGAAAAAAAGDAATTSTLSTWGRIRANREAAGFKGFGSKFDPKAGGGGVSGRSGRPTKGAAAAAAAEMPMPVMGGGGKDKEEREGGGKKKHGRAHSRHLSLSTSGVGDNWLSNLNEAFKTPEERARAEQESAKARR
jgi:hypothetical protein